MDLSQLTDRINTGLAQLRYGEEPAALYEPIRYIMALGGKRIRPLLTLLGAYVFTDELEPALKPALATEVFHNFTLLHDDLMDQAPLRRGQATVHEKWNPNVAILSGDVMLVRAYELFLDVPAELLPHVLRRFSQTAAEVCEGQQWDMNFETETEVSIEQYLDMIRLKTAVLLGFALELGALLGGASRQDADHLRQFGVGIGVAFQLRDDLLDVYGDVATFGKRVGGDILSDKKTYLLLTAQAQANEAQRAVLAQHIGQPVPDADAKVQAVRAIYDELEIRPQTEALINDYFLDALQHLERVAAPETRKKPLHQLALQLMEREQ
ncbi:geranylgeranyl diphosphate synthase type II [Hymenobacter luteus]|uniref:Geranylgeranyl diphosphate synthase type II n=2 Tax=Hymenobacter TaxID=89966 RepID=A0A7W9T626_9BACT|nr:polyprenyl synthetase family protein [Hymenobacter latericoloratus]MBB4603343.1 geranylgeranyl diphosphate synthase type II [Hymenobacter latericoloratus]MBB6061099.1 geranylgeranyl diphosphate synthase type II [Hymenobacter luteus]